MAKVLSDRTQRIVFGGLVVVLVAFGIYLSVDGFGGGAEDDDQQASEDSQSEPNGGDPATEAPEPIETTDAEDVEVLDWFPFTEEEAKTAAATAQGFAEAYWTIDYSESPEQYFESLKELATEDYAENLEENSGASALWQEMANEEAIAEGRANVDSIRSFDDESMVFVVETQSITEGDDGSEEDQGDFAVTMVKEDGEWRVFDFQPADSGNLGEG